MILVFPKIFKHTMLHNVEENMVAAKIQIQELLSYKTSDITLLFLFCSILIYFFKGPFKKNDTRLGGGKLVKKMAKYRFGYF